MNDLVLYCIAIISLSGSLNMWKGYIVFYEIDSSCPPCAQPPVFGPHKPAHFPRAPRLLSAGLCPCYYAEIITILIHDNKVKK